ncbi:TPA: hypothetical protein ACWWCX_001784 [Enterococcus faecium]
MSWSHFKESVRKVILYPTFIEREKRLYEKYEVERHRVESLTKRQQHELYVRFKSNFEYRKTIASFVLITIFVSMVTGMCTIFFKFLKSSLNLFLEHVHTLDESKIIWELSVFIFISLLLLLSIMILVYIRNTYSLYKKLLLVEAVMKESKEGD